MKSNLHILNSREVRSLLGQLEKQYGCVLELDYVFLQSDKDKIFIINRDIEMIDFEQLRINSLGLYFCEISKGGELRLTMEGSQLVGRYARKNVAELSEEQVRTYFRGQEVDWNNPTDGQPFLILKFWNDFFGAAKCKDGKILNYLPKIHRTTELML